MKEPFITLFGFEIFLCFAHFRYVYQNLKADKINLPGNNLSPKTLNVI